MMANSFQQNYENAKKCVQALKGIKPIQMGGIRLIPQEQCLKLLRVLALKELEDIAQQEKEDKLRFKEQDLFLGKRKSSQRQETKEDGEQEELEIVKIKKIKRNEISSQNLNVNKLYEEKKEDNISEGEDKTNLLNQQFLSEYNCIQFGDFDKCFHSQLFSMIYSNFDRSSSDIAKLFYSLTNVSEIFKHLKTIYKNQSIIINKQPKIFEECFGYVAENIILESEDFVNDIIKDYTMLQSFIEETKIRTEVIQHEYRQDVQKFQDKDFSPLLKLFTDICSQLSLESKEDQRSKEELRVAFKHYIKINHRTSLLKMAVGEYEKIIQGENLLKEAFTEKLYLLKKKKLDSNESDHISSFLVYMVFRIRPLFEDLFESFQQYSQSVQQQIMNILTRDQNKTKLKGYLQNKPGQKVQQQSFLPILISTFEYNNSYLLQVFIYDLLTRQDTQIIDDTEKKRILDLLKGHINQTPNIFDFYKSFPEYFEETIIQQYENLKDLQAPNCEQFREKFSFIPETSVKQTHLILLKRFLQEDSWFITKENMSEFISYFIEKVDRDELLDFLLKLVAEEKQNLNVLIAPLLIKINFLAINEQNEKQEKQIQNIVVEMVQNRIWETNKSFQEGLKIYFNKICLPEVKNQLFQRITQHFSTQQNGKDIIQQFQERFP